MSKLFHDDKAKVYSRFLRLLEEQGGITSGDVRRQATKLLKQAGDDVGREVSSPETMLGDALAMAEASGRVIVYMASTRNYLSVRPVKRTTELNGEATRLAAAAREVLEVLS